MFGVSQKSVARLFLLLVVVFASSCNATDNRVTGSNTEEVGHHEITDDLMPRMIELYTPYCPSCKKMEPIVKALVTQCDQNGVRVETVDVSEESNEHLMNQHSVRAVPTFLFLDEYGTEVARLVGFQTEQSLKQSLSVLRGEDCPGMTILKNTPKGGDTNRSN